VGPPIDGSGLATTVHERQGRIMTNWPTPYLPPGSVRRIAISLWQWCARPPGTRTGGRGLPQRAGRRSRHDRHDSYQKNCTACPPGSVPPMHAEWKKAPGTGTGAFKKISVQS